MTTRLSLLPVVPLRRSRLYAHLAVWRQVIDGITNEARSACEVGIVSLEWFASVNTPGPLFHRDVNAMRPHLTPHNLIQPLNYPDLTDIPVRRVDGKEIRTITFGP